VKNDGVGSSQSKVTNTVPLEEGDVWGCLCCINNCIIRYVNGKISQGTSPLPLCECVKLNCITVCRGNVAKKQGKVAAFGTHSTCKETAKSRETTRNQCPVCNGHIEETWSTHSSRNDKASCFGIIEQ
jgi:hypothetical protein